MALRNRRVFGQKVWHVAAVLLLWLAIVGSTPGGLIDQPATAAGNLAGAVLLFAAMLHVAGRIRGDGDSSAARE